jgi:hypothetical protein
VVQFRRLAHQRWLIAQQLLALVLELRDRRPAANRVETEGVLQGRQAVAYRFHLLRLLRSGDENRAGFGVAQLLLDLFGGEREVQGDGHRARVQNRKVGDDPLVAVLGQNRDAVAGLHAPRDQGGGERLHIAPNGLP